jgi:NlpC/P60 family putative phage cell wall peptidase
MRKQIVNAAIEWLETPYHHHARVKGVGIDCAQLLVAVALDLGLLNERQAQLVPNYPPEWHLHNREEHLLEYLELMGCVETSKPGIGDIMCFKFGRTCSHVGIMVNDHQFIHACLRSGKVVVNSLNDDWTTRWAKTYQFPGVGNG